MKSHRTLRTKIKVKTVEKLALDTQFLIIYAAVVVTQILYLDRRKIFWDLALSYFDTPSNFRLEAVYSV